LSFHRYSGNGIRCLITESTGFAKRMSGSDRPYVIYLYVDHQTYVCPSVCMNVV